MKNAFLFVFAFSFVSISCKKDSTPAPVTPVDKYMTFTTGSIWNFETILNPSSANPVSTSYSIISSSRDTTINAAQYHVYTNNNGGPNEYFYNTGNDYYTYTALPLSLGGGNVVILYLKDNAAVGTEWSETYPVIVSGFPFNLTLTNKIEERGLIKAVNGKQYSDVIRVKRTLSANIPIAYTLTDEINYYYAPKYGSIKEETKLDLIVTGIPGVSPINLEQEKELKSATLQ